MSKIYFNGNIVPEDSKYLNQGNRGLRYGDALFETMRASNGVIFFWEDHYLRLMASMRMLRMEIPMSFTLETLDDAIQKVLVANELDKWLVLENERFSKLVLRLFHTELEAVYEEFNRGQDNDFRKSYAAMLDGLFPTHPYGQQSTIGTSDHLKNPSMVHINDYFNKYYVPNNMAIVLVGDLDFDTTIQKIEATFGQMKYKEVKHPTLPVEEPLKGEVVREVFGPNNESVSVAYRTPGIGTEEEKIITLIEMLLMNGNAGLFDLNLNQKQAVQYAGCSPTFLNDYGYHSFSGAPKTGQTLDEVKDLLLAQIEKLKKGEFDEWMIDAVVNDLKLSQTRQYENNTALASAYFNAFIHHENWNDKVKFLDDLKSISKQELVDFANKF